MEDSIVLYTIPYYKNRGFVPKIKIKMYSNGENTIMTMRYSLYFEAELIIIITNILLIISSLLILMITPNNRYWGLYIIIFVIFCDFGFYKTFKDETEKIIADNANEKLAIKVDLNVMIVKDKEEAKTTFRIAKDGEEPVRIIKELKDTNLTHCYKQKRVRERNSLLLLTAP